MTRAYDSRRRPVFGKRYLSRGAIAGRTTAAVEIAIAMHRPSLTRGIGRASGPIHAINYILTTIAIDVAGLHARLLRRRLRAEVNDRAFCPRLLGIGGNLKPFEESPVFAYDRAT